MYQSIRIETGIQAASTEDWRDYIRSNVFQCDAWRDCDADIPFVVEMGGAFVDGIILYGLRHHSALDYDQLHFTRHHQHIAADGQDYYGLGFAGTAMRFAQDSASYELPAKSLTLFDITHPYDIIHQHANDGFIVFFPKTMIADRLEVAEQRGPRILDSTEGIGRLLRTQCVETVKVIKEATDPHKLHGVGAHLAALAALAFRPSDEGIDRAQEDLAALRYKSILACIDEHLHEPHLSPQWIADRLGISRSYLSKILARHETGFVEILRKRRLVRAAAALASSAFAHLSVTEIAYRYGFNSSSHFSRSFARQYGVSPRAYRARCHITTSE